MRSSKKKSRVCVEKTRIKKLQKTIARKTSFRATAGVMAIVDTTAMGAGLLNQGTYMRPLQLTLREAASGEKIETYEINPTVVP